MSDWNKVKTRTGELFEVVRQKLCRGGFLLKQEAMAARKNMDLMATHRRLKRAYASLGKLVFEAHTREADNLSVVMERAEAKKLVFIIESLRIEEEIQRKEIEAYRAQKSP